MSRLSRFALLSALTLTLWLVGSQPAHAWESCAVLDGTSCDPYWDYVCRGDDNHLYECYCMRGRLLCPL